jgi:hypothetical protein
VCIKKCLDLVVSFSPDCPFLQGRGFVFASQYSKLLSLQLAGHYLEAAVQVLESSEATIPVKVSAVRAIHKSVRFILISV